MSNDAERIRCGWCGRFMTLVKNGLKAIGATCSNCKLEWKFDDE